MENFDFSGYVTRADMKCTDGLTIRKGAFAHCDGAKVPLVWNHQHDNPENVLGHVILQHRDDGVYGYAKLNDSKSGKLARVLIEHGDIEAMSIFANQLKKKASDVLHGMIREVSLVLAGANPGAFIDEIALSHGEDADGEAVIYSGEAISLCHADDKKSEDEKPKTTETKEDDMSEETKKPDGEKTVADVLDTLNEEQEKVVYALIGKALEAGESDEEEKDNNEEEKTMRQNAFDKDVQQNENTLSHSDMNTIIANAKRNGSLRDAFIQHGVNDEVLQHAVTNEAGKTITYGMADIEYLFPDARTVNATPDFISRDMGWVKKVMQGAKHLPFSRVKSVHANITMEEARAKGYIKGKQKAEEVFALLKRVTTPTTVYKKQKLDRDDIVDITDMDIVAWLKGEMRLMLDEEIARAALVGDGRLPGTDDKISEDNIRPIWKDNATYVVRKAIDGAAHADEDSRAKAFIRACIKARKDYKGSGNPALYTTEDMVTDCLLLEDQTGRVIYDTLDKLKTALRVSDIITVPVMEGLTREGTGDEAGSNFGLMGIMVNMNDYAFGADKGGSVNMFDDFDIDFNQQKYLIETRCSGALIKPYSAIVIELKTTKA